MRVRFNARLAAMNQAWRIWQVRHQKGSTPRRISRHAHHKTTWTVREMKLWRKNTKAQQFRVVRMRGWRQWIRHDSIDQFSFKNLMRHRQVRHRKKFTSLLYLRSACKCHGISRMNGPVHSWCVAMHPEQRFWLVRLQTSHAPHATKSRRDLGDTCLLPCLQEHDTSHTISHKCRVVWLPTLLQWIQHDVIDYCGCK